MKTVYYKFFYTFREFLNERLKIERKLAKTRKQKEYIVSATGSYADGGFLLQVLKK